MISWKKAEYRGQVFKERTGKILVLSSLNGMMNYFTFDDRTKRYEHYYTTIAELEKMLQKFVRDEKKLLNEIEKECLNYNYSG